MLLVSRHGLFVHESKKGGYSEFEISCIGTGAEFFEQLGVEI